MWLSQKDQTQTFYILEADDCNVVVTCIDITASWDWGCTAETGGTRENTNTTYTKQVQGDENKCI